MSSARSRRVAIAGSLLLVVVAAGASPVLAANATVAIAGKAYNPATVTINVGDTVTWNVTESIGEPHSVTSGTLEDSGKVFDSGTAGSNSSFKLRDVGQTYEFTFDEAGEYLYFCVIHPEMTGKVVVLAEGASPPPSIEPPPSEQEHTGVPAERRVLAGAILAVSLVLMFGMAWVWRRMNPA